MRRAGEGATWCSLPLTRRVWPSVLLFSGGMGGLILGEGGVWQLRSDSFLGESILPLVLWC